MNRFRGLSAFIERWEQGRQEAEPDVALRRSVVGNVNVSGSARAVAAYAFVPGEAAFDRAVEPRILPLVKSLIEHLNVVTYSSCEGHAAASGAAARPAHVGIVARDAAEQDKLLLSLRTHVGVVEDQCRAPEVVMRLEPRVLEGDTGSLPCVDLWFLNADAADAQYFRSLQRVLDALTQQVGADLPAARRAAFGTPLEGFARAGWLRRRARVERARRMVSAFAERFPDVGSPEIVAALAQLPGYVEISPRCVHRALTALGFATHSDASPLAAVAQALVWLAASGAPLDLELPLSQPTRLVWHDHVVPACDYIALSSSEPAVLVTSGGAKRASFHADGLAEDRRCVPLPSFELPGSKNRTRAHALMPWYLDACPVLCTTFAPTLLETPAVLEELAPSLALLAEAAPEYASWCDEALTDLVPIQGSLRQTISSSFGDAPGQLAVSFPNQLVGLGELLVHESAHENFHLAQELEAVTDGSDARLYWSPVKKAQRSIDRILLAYHATLNILAFLRKVMQRELDRDGFAAAGYAQHLQSAEELASHLQQTQCLTSMGRSLFVPIEEALA